MTYRTTRIITVSATIVAAMAPGAAAQDLRSPDAREPFRPATVTQDLRSPDAQQPFRPVAVTQDLRSPDASEPYAGVPVQVVEPAPVVQVRRVDSGFDWSDAIIGAGVLLSLVLLVMGGSAVTRRQHHPAMG